METLFPWRCAGSRPQGTVCRSSQGGDELAISVQWRDSSGQDAGIISGSFGLHWSFSALPNPILLSVIVAYPLQL